MNNKNCKNCDINNNYIYDNGLCICLSCGCMNEYNEQIYSYNDSYYIKKKNII